MSANNPVPMTCPIGGKRLFDSAMVTSHGYLVIKCRDCREYWRISWQDGQVTCTPDPQPDYPAA